MKDQETKPDPFKGTGPFKRLFASETGLDEFLECHRITDIDRMVRHAQSDQSITPGKWLKSGYANATNTGAGKLTRSILLRLSPICASEIVPTIFGVSRNDLLGMDDRDLGRKAKITFRELTDRQHADQVAGQLLGNCTEAVVSAAEA